MPDFSFTDELYRPLFANMAVPAILTLASGAVYSQLPDGSPFLALDKTMGLDLSGGAATIETIKPVAEIMAADMVTLGFTRKDIEPVDGVAATIALNGVVWNIVATKPNQSSFGPNDGTLFLILEGDLE